MLAHCIARNTKEFFSVKTFFEAGTLVMVHFNITHLNIGFRLGSYFILYYLIFLCSFQH